MIDLGLIWACIENENENGMIDSSRVWKRAFENIQDMKMNENEWMKMSEKREDEVDIAEEVHTAR